MYTANFPQMNRNYPECQAWKVLGLMFNVVLLPPSGLFAPCLLG